MSEIFADLGEKWRNRCSYHRVFRRTFGRNIRDFLDPVTGFDVIKFDDEIAKAPDGESTEDAVKRQWGEDAVVLIRSILKGNLCAQQ